jgi:hypothetical protein
MTDVLMGACGLGALAAAWAFVRKPTARRALLAGAWVGLCAAAKYNGAYVAFVPAVAWALAWWRDPVGRPPRRAPYWLALAAAMALAAGVVFLLVNPFLLLDSRPWLRSFFFQVNDYQATDSLATMGTILTTYLDQLRRTEPILLVASLCGGALLLFDAVRRPDPRLRAAAWLLLPFALV